MAGWDQSIQLVCQMTDLSAPSAWLCSLHAGCINRYDQSACNSTGLSLVTHVTFGHAWLELDFAVHLITIEDTHLSVCGTGFTVQINIPTSSLWPYPSLRRRRGSRATSRDVCLADTVTQVPNGKWQMANSNGRTSWSWHPQVKSRDTWLSESHKIPWKLCKVCQACQYRQLQEFYQLTVD